MAFTLFIRLFFQRKYEYVPHIDNILCLLISPKYVLFQGKYLSVISSIKLPDATNREKPEQEHGV